MSETTPWWCDEIGARLERLADRLETDLAGLATLERRTSEDFTIRSVHVKARDPAAASVAWVDMAHSLQVQVGGQHQLGGRWELDRTTDDVRFVNDVVGAAIHGRVVEVLGPSRSRVEITLSDGEVIVSTSSAVPGGCLPIPGMVRRGRRVRYAPYRHQPRSIDADPRQ